MTFLQFHSEKMRVYMQFLSFMEDTYLDFAGELLDYPIFRLPGVEVSPDDDFFSSIPDNIRLGKRLEYFFTHIIHKSDRYRMILRNYQVQRGVTKTLGELDYILYDKKRSIYMHVELAGKIYLYDDKKADAELGRWVGPDKRDSLVQKIDKLYRFQFPLLQEFRRSDEGRRLLSRRGIKESTLVEQYLCMKTRLFVPYHRRNDTYPYVRKENINGYYLHKYEWDEVQDNKSLYFLPEKQDWMVSPEHGRRWCELRGVKAQVNRALSLQRSPMVWKKTPDGYERFFVVWW